MEARLPEKEGNTFSPCDLKTGVGEEPDHFPGFPLLLVACLVIGLFYHAEGHAGEKEIPVVRDNDDEPPAGPEDAVNLPYRVEGRFQVFEDIDHDAEVEGGGGKSKGVHIRVNRGEPELLADLDVLSFKVNTDHLAVGVHLDQFFQSDPLPAAHVHDASMVGKDLGEDMRVPKVPVPAPSASLGVLVPLVEHPFLRQMMMHRHSPIYQKPPVLSIGERRDVRETGIGYEAEPVCW
jgi:hypothetical protein